LDPVFFRPEVMLHFLWAQLEKLRPDSRKKKSHWEKTNSRLFGNQSLRILGEIMEQLLEV